MTIRGNPLSSTVCLLRRMRSLLRTVPGVADASLHPQAAPGCQVDPATHNPGSSSSSAGGGCAHSSTTPDAAASKQGPAAQGHALPLQQVAVENAQELSYGRFIGSYMAPNQPVLIRVRRPVTPHTRPNDTSHCMLGCPVYGPVLICPRCICGQSSEDTPWPHGAWYLGCLRC